MRFRPATPYGEAAQGLGDAFVKGLMLAPQRERAEAAAGFDRLRTEQLQGQMAAQQTIGALFPRLQTMTLPQAYAEFGQALSAFGPDGLRHLGQIALGATGAMPNLTPEQMTMPQLSSGMAFGQTVQGTREGEAAQTGRAFGVARINNDGAMARDMAKPMAAFDPTTMQPRFTTQGQAGTSGLQPVLPLNEARGVAFQQLPQATQGLAVGPSMDQVQANVAVQSMQPSARLTPQQQAILTPPSRQQPQQFNYSAPDGTRGIGTVDAQGRPVDATTGEPLPPGSVRVNLQVDDPNKLEPRENVADRNERIAAEQFGATIRDITQMADRSPQAIGAVGNAMRIGQTIAGLAENLGLSSQVAAVEARIAGERPEIQAAFGGLNNSDLGDIGRLGRIAIYQAAQMLGQNGRDVSDKDVAVLMTVVGDPTSWLANARSFRAGLDRLTAYTERNVNIARQVRGLPPVRLGTGAAGVSSDPNPNRSAGATPPPAASSTAAPGGQPSRVLEFDAQGNLIRR